jgi:hypothetical protein
MRLQHPAIIHRPYVIIMRICCEALHAMSAVNASFVHICCPSPASLVMNDRRTQILLGGHTTCFKGPELLIGATHTAAKLGHDTDRRTAGDADDAAQLTAIIYLLPG